jgi:ABC-2 type transport system permease protein
MVINKIRKYIKIYLKLLRFGFILGATYRVSFLIEVLVELGYIFAFILFFQIVYGDLKSVVGWTYYEIMFLTGLTIVLSELMIGAVYVFNLYRLPRKIVLGDIDTVLLKPINSLFYLSLGLPYFASFVSAVTGIYLMWLSLIRLQLVINVMNLIFSIIILGCGLIIYYSLSILVASLSFKFLNAEMIPRIAQASTDYFMERPHQIYQGIFRVIFFFIFPVIYIVSVPSYTLLKKFEIQYLLGAVALATLFLFLANAFWNKMIKQYSSASS